MFKVGDEITL